MTWNVVKYKHHTETEKTLLSNEKFNRNTEISLLLYLELEDQKDKHTNNHNAEHRQYLKIVLRSQSQHARLFGENFDCVTQVKT